MPRKLSLRREVLTEIDTPGLAAVVAAGPTNTCFSCLTFVSCNPVHCVTRYPEFVKRTVEQLSYALEQCPAL